MCVVFVKVTFVSNRTMQNQYFTFKFHNHKCNKENEIWNYGIF
jgi:hypothetical protein